MLTVSLLDAPLTHAVLDGTAVPDGLELSARTAASVDANSRSMLTLEFDVAEMSFATYLRARLEDRIPLIALPAFTGRCFVQPLVGIGEGSAVQAVEDLPGLRVAVPQYWMTSSVWHRAVLTGYYGIAPSEMTWITTVEERFQLEPRGVRVERCSDGRTPAQLVEAGEADAVLSPRPPRGGLRSLFPDPWEQLRYYEATSVLPIMHLVVVQERLLDERPAEVAALWQALLRARALQRPGPAVPRVPEAGSGLLGADPWEYGVEPNRASLQALFSTAASEGLISDVPDPADVFVPLTITTGESSARGKA